MDSQNNGTGSPLAPRSYLTLVLVGKVVELCILVCIYMAYLPSTSTSRLSKRTVIDTEPRRSRSMHIHIRDIITSNGYQKYPYYPGWMEGEHPKPEDGIVDRDVCFTTNGNCCSSRKQIKVVACSKGNENYYLYRLYATSSNYGTV